ncbi:hypothetical protein A0257_07890 [Hymenobacter psoromatis]|nr:hypothetical protein A0257_07890 [Hymenobacter psoromatis]
MERIHEDVMQSFFAAYRRLENYVTDIQPEKELIARRLKILDERINVFKPGTVTWPQKFEARLLAAVSDARSVADLEFEVQKLIDYQEERFATLLNAYRTLQPTTPALEHK